MSFRSMIRCRSVRALALLGAMLAGFTLGAPQPALAGKNQPSPFAGRYQPGSVALCSITISDSGRISGFVPCGFYCSTELSGTISDPGAIKLKFISTFHRGTPGIGRPISKSTSTAVGQCTLDDQGNLVGILEYHDGFVADLFWPRCN